MCNVVAAGTCLVDLALDGTLVDAAGNVLDVDADGNPYCLSKLCMLEKTRPMLNSEQESALEVRRLWCCPRCCSRRCCRWCRKRAFRRDGAGVVVGR